MINIYNYCGEKPNIVNEIFDKNIVIRDMLISGAEFKYPKKLNIPRWILTNEVTPQIDSVQDEYFIVGENVDRYNSTDRLNLRQATEEDRKKYRIKQVMFAPYSTLYIESTLRGYPIKYGDPIPMTELDIWKEWLENVQQK